MDIVVSGKYCVKVVEDTDLLHYGKDWSQEMLLR